jgi:iron complex outermembrane receptor protein
MKIGLTSASSIALLIGVAGLGSQAWAQDKTPSDQSTQVEEIVVTGSNIRGSALDTALPVEVYSQQDLEKQGSPTALEFAKSLTISGPTTGESYYFGGPNLVGSVNFNLRGLGADKTLVLLNGRRMAQNTANMPSIALSRTEVLKDGAAVITARTPRAASSISSPWTTMSGCRPRRSTSISEARRATIRSA